LTARLRLTAKTAKTNEMKFSLSILVYLLIGFFLSWGIILMIHGSPWLFIASLLIYILAFAKIGCMTH